MPNMPLKHKLKLVSNFVVEGRYREIYNMFWVYPLWWNRKWASFLMNRFLPKMGIDLFPPFLEIEPSTVCNFKCVCCEHTYWKEPPKNMSFAQFKKIFDDFGKPKWLGLTGIGSSYLNKDFHRMLRYAKSKGTLIEVMDHFAHFKDENQIRELIEIGPDFQFVSTYGATKNSFEKVCVGSDYDVVKKNIRTFVRLKKEMKKRFPILNFHYIVTRDSKDELLEFLDFVHELDTEVGEILVTPMTHAFKEAKKFAVKIDKAYVEKVNAKAKIYGIPVTINMNAYEDVESEGTKPPIRNCKEIIMPFIFADGKVTPCCGLNEANNREWQKDTSPGNALEKPFKEIWYSPKYVKIRKMIRANEIPQECEFCPAYNMSSFRK